MQVKNKKILLLGESGFLGSYLLKTLPHYHLVYIAERNANIPCDANENIIVLPTKLDIHDIKTIEKLMSQSNPDITINCIARVQNHHKLHDTAEETYVNGIFPHVLEAITKRHGSKLIHFSTDAIFSGLKGNYSELDTPDPIDLYGRSKLLGELMQSHSITLRTTFFGLSETSKGLVSWVLLNNAKTINGYKNYIFSGISLHTLSMAVVHIINMSEFPSGIYHAAGPSISKYDFIKNIAEVFGLTINLQPEFNPQINRSLNSGRFWSMLNQEMPSTEHMIKNTFLEYSSKQT